MPRPNIAPRPVCRYYNTSRGCFAGDKCHYLHGDPSEHKYAPYEENKTCRYFSQGFCKRGRECWYKHVEPKADESSSTSALASTEPASSSSSADLTPKQLEQESLEKEDVACGICFEERPALYGLLNGCSHAFCLTCIRRWRDPEGKGIDLTESGMHKTCPMCRTKSKFVVPSSLFFPQDDPRKVAVVENYKQSMSRVPCRYFMKSSPENRFCPFGKDCFYQHLNEDGTTHVFTDGVDAMMRRRRRISVVDEIWDPYPLNIVLSALEDPIDFPLSEEFETTLAVNVEPGATGDNLESSTDETDDNNICREIFSLHLGQMMRAMGHACSGAGTAASSAIDLEALFAEPMSFQPEENWDEDEPFVVYTGDLRGGEDADDEDDGEEEEESDSYWDDFLSNPPVTSVAQISHSMFETNEDDEDDYYEDFTDSPVESSESEADESEAETETEDVFSFSNTSATASLLCSAVVDDLWDISLLADESSRFVDQLR